MPTTDPDLYLVRIWRGGSAFRATARRVDDEDLLVAHSVLELAELLAAPPRPHAPPGADADDTPQRSGTSC